MIVGVCSQRSLAVLGLTSVRRPMDMVDAAIAAEASQQLEQAGLDETSITKCFDDIVTKMEQCAMEQYGAKPKQTEVNPRDKMETALAEASTSGRVDPRSALGQRFLAESKKNEQLAKEYNACLGVKAKADFRAAWASEKWRTICEQRIEQTTQSFSEFSKGKYMSLAKAVQESGGNALAVAAVRTRLSKCLELGPPFVRISPWTEQLEILMVEDGMEQRFEQLWMQRLTAEPVHCPNAPEPDQRPKKHSKNETPSKAALKDDAASTPPAKQRKTDMPPSVADKGESKGLVMQRMKAMEKKKAVIVAAVSNASELIGIIGHDDSWAWARNEQNLGALEAMLKEVSKLKNEFAKSWLTLESHAVRSIFEPTLILQELSGTVPALEKAAVALHDKVQRLQKMRLANSA